MIDFAERRIAPDEIKSAGYAGVVNYVSEARPGSNFEAKPLTREYADALRAAGLHIVSNYQYGKPNGPHPRISPAASTVVWPTRTRLYVSMTPPGAAPPRRSSSAWTTTSTATPGIPWQSTGFEVSTRY